MSLAPLPLGPLYKPPFVFLDFQVDFIERCYGRRFNLVAADMGLGKSHMSMCVMGLLFEDDLIDQVILECESSKLVEWKPDLAAYTQLSVGVYPGTLTHRAKMRKALPQVLLTTYETFGNDALSTVVEPDKRGRRRKVKHPGPLMEAMEGRRILVVTDEMAAKLGASRTTAKYQAHEYAYGTWRDRLRIMALTATPMERDPESYFNLCRLLDPMRTGTVAAFERDHIASYDIFGNPSRWKNLSAERCAPGVMSLRDKIGDLLMVKHKTDPDVVDRFPTMPEPDYTYLRFDSKGQQFYEAVAGYFSDDEDPRKVREGYTVLRQIADHPCALLRSQGAVAQEIVNTVGEAGLSALGAPKLDALVSRLKLLVKGQGAQVVVFTFFGQSVLPLIADRLVEEEFSVSLNHGQMSMAERGVSLDAFKTGATEVLVSSDAGARGLNLPNAQYAEQYEMARNHTLYVQRINRISRLGGGHATVFAHTLVMADTVEEGIIAHGLKTHGWSNQLLDDGSGDDEVLSIDTMRALLKIRRHQVR